MRIFAAIPFPQPWKAPLLKVLIDGHTIKGKWEHPDNFHITLRFIGEVDEQAYARYVAALKTVQAAAFDIALHGFGRFPPAPRNAPRILWVGVSPSPGLMALQASIASILGDSGLPPDKHEIYHPHMTVARFKASHPIKALDQFLEEYSGFQTEPMPIDAFVLYKSTLTPQRAVYQEIERFPLRA